MHTDCASFLCFVRTSYRSICVHVVPNYEKRDGEKAKRRVRITCLPVPVYMPVWLVRPDKRGLPLLPAGQKVNKLKLLRLLRMIGTFDGI